jgi:hypothetical protein
MRDASGRFCKAVPKASLARQTEKESVNQVKAVEEGESREATTVKGIIRLELKSMRLYLHPRLRASICVKFYDHFTEHDLQR